MCYIEQIIISYGTLVYYPSFNTYIIFNRYRWENRLLKIIIFIPILIIRMFKLVFNLIALEQFYLGILFLKTFIRYTQSVIYLQ